MQTCGEIRATALKIKLIAIATLPGIYSLLQVNFIQEEAEINYG